MTTTKRALREHDDAAQVAVVLFVRAPSVDARDKALGLGGPSVDARALAASLTRTVDVARAASGTALIIALDDADGRVPGAERAQHVVSQRGATFEERFLHALSDAGALGYDKLIAIGGDTPGLTSRDIERARDAVRDGEVALGPAHDGGFYLLALDVGDIALLRALPYQTSALVGALRSRLSAAGRAVTLLERKVDVDDARSARAVLALLSRASERYLGAALHALDAIARAVAGEDAPCFAPVRVECAPSTGPPR